MSALRSFQLWMDVRIQDDSSGDHILDLSSVRLPAQLRSLAVDSFILPEISRYLHWIVYSEPKISLKRICISPIYSGHEKSFQTFGPLFEDMYASLEHLEVHMKNSTFLQSTRRCIMIGDVRSCLQMYQPMAFCTADHTHSHLLRRAR